MTTDAVYVFVSANALEPSWDMKRITKARIKVIEESAATHGSNGDGSMAHAPDNGRSV